MKAFGCLLICILCVFANQAQANEIFISSFCQQIKTYQSEGQADYTPGVDVNGNAVVSADAGDTIIDFPILDPINMPIQVDLQDYVDLDLDNTLPGSILEPSLADLKVFQDGRIQYNGQDITPQIQEKCSWADDESVPEAASQPAQKPQVKPQVKPGAKLKPKKPAPPKKKAIDVEILKPQEEPQNDVLEGQYP